MPSYLVQVSYSTESLAALIKKPQNRAEAVRKPVEKLGGKIEGFWFSFGDYDAVLIVQMPDNVSVAALSLAAGAGGACKGIKTTPLISVEDGLEAMKKAGTCGYKPAK
jgi:uncharacterized protein with GYD domain